MLLGPVFVSLIDAYCKFHWLAKVINAMAGKEECAKYVGRHASLIEVRVDVFSDFLVVLLS